MNKRRPADVAQVPQRLNTHRVALKTKNINKVFNVLIFPGGTEIALEIWRALKDVRTVSLFSVGSRVSNHAPFVFVNHFDMPRVDEKGWVAALNKIIQRHHIDFIFPAHDDVVLALAKAAPNLLAKPVTSSLETCSIARSKRRTYEHLRAHLRVPTVYSDVAAIPSFPVFAKPDEGQGSQGTQRIEDLKSVQSLLRAQPNVILTEFLEGPEFTIDCFTHRRQGLLFCQGRERIRMRSGISMNSKTVSPSVNVHFRRYAETIMEHMEFHGAWFFQMKQNRKGEYVLLEVAPRISGTMATHRVMGVNFPLLSLYEAQEQPVEIMTHAIPLEIDRALTNRYRIQLMYKTVYVDWDDTLMLKGQVNIPLIGFLFQAANRGCRIILLTKTREDIVLQLKKFRLAGFFDQVKRLEPGECKSDFINPRGSIFIDDSFRERKDVHERHRIPTFDGSMLELLIDERV